MIRIKQIASVIIGIFPMVTLASDFHWPEFHVDTSPVAVPDWSAVAAKVSAWVDKATDELWVVVAIAVMVASVFGYAKALTEVKMGRLIVYRDWGDFAKSALWIVLIPLGVGWVWEDSTTIVGKLLGVAAIGYGLVSFWQMLSGAFKYNSGDKRWLALFARVAVTLLFVFALAKLSERLEDYKRGKFGYGPMSVVRGVLIPLAIFGWVFHALIQPMVGTYYYRLRRSVGGW